MYGSPIPNPCSPILLFQETQPFVIYTFIHYLRTLTKRFFKIHLEFLYSLFFVPIVPSKTIPYSRPK